MTIAPGQIRYGRLMITDPSTHQLRDADSTPVVTLELDGATNNTSVTVTSVSGLPGEYRYTYIVPGVDGDQIAEIVTVILDDEPYRDQASVSVGNLLHVGDIDLDPQGRPTVVLEPGTVDDIAAAILVTPGQPIKTNPAGQVETSNPGTASLGDVTITEEDVQVSDA